MKAHRTRVQYQNRCKSLILSNEYTFSFQILAGIVLMIFCLLWIKLLIFN